MDYSISDAVNAGFGKIVFLIRKQFEDNFRELFASKLDGKVNYEFAFQELDMYLGGAQIPEERTKPWGTGHAVLCTKGIVNEPFAVINADDFYGADSFKKAYAFLSTQADDKTYGVVGYNIMNTLSSHGTVNRGVCGLNDNGNLQSVVERYNIAEKNGVVIADDGDEPRELPKNTVVSMNFWCFHPSIYDLYEEQFKQFISEQLNTPKSEFLIPSVVDSFINKGGVVKVIATSAPWFGVTYKEDAPAVQQQLNDLIAAGVYSTNLWG